jgi:hypothetical protein
LDFPLFSEVFHGPAPFSKEFSSMTFQPLLPGLLPRPPLCLPPGSHQLWSFPDLPREERCRHAKVLGLAGECLVDSILLRYGLSVMRLPEFTAVDRLILHPEQILRLQVKTTTMRQNGAWFSTPITATAARRKGCGPMNQTRSICWRWRRCRRMRCASPPSAGAATGSAMPNSPGSRPIRA